MWSFEGLLCSLDCTFCVLRVFERGEIPGHVRTATDYISAQVRQHQICGLHRAFYTHSGAYFCWEDMFRNFIRTFCSRCNSFKCFHCLDNNIISINSRFLKSPSGTKVSKFNFKHLLHSKFCYRCCVECSILRCVFGSEPYRQSAYIIVTRVWWGLPIPSTVWTNPN